MIKINYELEQKHVTFIIIVGSGSVLRTKTSLMNVYFMNNRLM